MKKKLLLLMVLCAFLAGMAGAAYAAYPDKAITIVCPWGAGGGTDRVVRALAAELEKILGQPVIVENRTGGDGAVGHGYGARARPDGYTLTSTTFELATMHYLGIEAAPTYEDYEHIAMVNDDPAAIGVKTDAEWKDLAELFAWIKANPGKAQFSGTALAGIWDLARLTLMNAAGLNPGDVLWIPSSVSAAAIPEILGGHIHAISCGIAEMKTQLDNKEIRALVIMSAERSPNFPDVPTAKEQGYDVTYSTLRGLSAPKGTPKEIVDLLADAVKKACESPTFVDFMNMNSFAIHYMGPAEFTAHLAKTDADNKTAMELGGYLKK